MVAMRGAKRTRATDGQDHIHQPFDHDVEPVVRVLAEADDGHPVEARGRQGQTRHRWHVGNQADIDDGP
jgi:hypothetical protein